MGKISQTKEGRWTVTYYDDLYTAQDEIQGLVTLNRPVRHTPRWLREFLTDFRDAALEEWADEGWLIFDRYRDAKLFRLSWWKIGYTVRLERHLVSIPAMSDRGGVLLPTTCP